MKRSGRNRTRKCELHLCVSTRRHQRHKVMRISLAEEPGLQNVSMQVGTEVRIALVVNDEQAAVVRQVYAWTADGASLNQIADRLQAQHVPAPRARWGPGTVRRILTEDVF